MGDRLSETIARPSPPGSGDSPTVSVIVCAYSARRWELLNAAVASLRSQTLTPHEILVVVDHNPELLARVRTELPGVASLANAEQSGLAGARNTGVSAASGSIVAFLDDDAVADTNLLHLLAAPYRDGDVVAVGGSVIPRWSRGRPAWFPPEFDWVVGCSHAGLPRERSQVRNLIGANMSFRRSVFGTVRFYSGLGHAQGKSIGGEETDLCIRLSLAWPKRLIVYEPRAVVGHDVPVERTRWRYFASRCYNEGRSKGILTRRVGRRAGLASERAYTFRVLPAAVPRAVRDAARERRPAILLRIPVVALGLAVTGLGYMASLAGRRSAADASPSAAHVPAAQDGPPR